MSLKAIVLGKIGNRRGKGFSKAELNQVGLTFKQALKLGISIDTRRRTKHEENVEVLKKLNLDLKKKKSREER